MSTTPQLDPSTFKPLAPAGSGDMPQLDPSTFKPLAAPPVQPAPSAAPAATAGTPQDEESQGPAHHMYQSIADAINKAGQYMAKAAQGDPNYEYPAAIEPINKFAVGATKEAAKTVLGVSHLMGSHEDQQKSQEPSL